MLSSNCFIVTFNKKNKEKKIGLGYYLYLTIDEMSAMS